jgi:hypothetical protein
MSVLALPFGAGQGAPGHMGGLNGRYGKHDGAKAAQESIQPTAITGLWRLKNDKPDRDECWRQTGRQRYDP